MIELHVWGPAFGLPSIDPQCLAAIAFLQQTVPRGKWQLVASSDPALCPTNFLPALRNGDVWVSGFRNISHCLAQVSAGEWILDAKLPERETADCTAFSSFVESHGQPLLDISLYVSSQNYSAVTRPAYNKIQKFPLPYLTPSSIRAAAKQRTDHLGLSSLDIDTKNHEASPEPSIIPASLRRPRQTVSSMLAASPEATAQIRLSSLATDFLEPMQALLGNKQYFVSDNHFSSLDCLALGYLALMVVPELPQPWLARKIVDNFPRLHAWTQDLCDRVFGKEKSTIEDAFLATVDVSDFDTNAKKIRGEGRLPWAPPYNRGAVDVGRVFVSSLADSIPVVSQLKKNTRIKPPRGGDAQDGDVQSSPWQYLGLAGSVIAGLGIGIGYMFQQAFVPWPGEPAEKQRQNDMGPLGEALGFYGNRSDTAVQSEKTMDSTLYGVPIVEIEVAQDTTRSTETVS
ncbi:hypothetical protein QTJ16_002158 [Diplocarpon rosae]|uniref:Mitochondrial import receptor subunit n=1 Tax=Diplocarpon rosae TaxID=946125 RepID=A0AAD9WF47_9HELO|nr:hypothetical protein QTJ16_002158 [Diplocarpon rosae]PBP16661.1 hypothetical protein BUE80_DR012524 [Diplocarpon rosae]